MKKSLSLFIAVLFALSLSTPVFAAATKASQSRYGSNATPNITDASNGNTADVSANGDLLVRRRVKVEVSAAYNTGITASNDRERKLVSTSATLHSVLFTGSTAGEMIAFYSSHPEINGNPLLEVEVATANSSIFISFEGGIPFTTEIEVKFGQYAVASVDFVTITYDTDSVS